ncbi:MAG: hypothetical protein DRJ42_29140, partial [Deltaproteobacteria bacterium]
MPRARPLQRSEVRQRTDKPTNSVILQYIGRRLYFDQYIYGYPDGTFYVCNADDVPLPESIEAMASEYRINFHNLPDAPRVKHAVIEALVTEAMVNAPELLADLAGDAPEWSPWERRDLERKHTIACARVVEVVRVAETDLKLRAAGITRPSFVTDPMEVFVGLEPVSVYGTPCPPAPAALPAPPVEPALTAIAPQTLLDDDPGAPGPDCVECGDDEFDSDLAPGSETVHAATIAVTVARESELPQRLPQGIRRRIKKMAPAVYLVIGDSMESRRDLCAALTDGR